MRREVGSTAAARYYHKAIRNRGVRRYGPAEGRRVMKIKRATVAWGVVWFAGVLALLTLGTLPGDLGQSHLGDTLCGPWG
jgi:hypothetical protein